MFHNKKTTILLIIIFLLILLFLVYISFIKKDELGKKLDKLKLRDVDKIMIVAHPDDEMLWGGNNLINDTYLVVCVTCGDDELREKEFERVMKKVKCPFLSLAYPDRDDWDDDNENIKKDLKEILEYKKYDMIVTHNPDGEYGHDQHKKVSEYVTEIADKTKLYYFNHYYTRSNLDSLNYCMASISDDQLKKKEDVLTLYESQEAIVNNHRPTIKYEKFISYSDWS